MGSGDWVAPVLGIGVLAVGGLFLLPSLLKAVKGEEEETTTNGNGNGDTVIITEKTPVIKPPFVDLGDLVQDIGGLDDVYLITDEDFDKLDIGKRDKRWLNRQRKIRDERLGRVIYGDFYPPGGVILPFAGFGGVNTVSPYGQGTTNEFQRLPWAESASRSNTQKNTINLY